MFDDEGREPTRFVVMSFVVRSKTSSDMKVTFIAGPTSFLASWRQHCRRPMRHLREDHGNKSKLIPNSIWKNIEEADLVMCVRQSVKTSDQKARALPPAGSFPGSLLSPGPGCDSVPPRWTPERADV